MNRRPSLQRPQWCRVLGCACAALLLNGCIVAFRTPVMAPQGVLFSRTRMPLTVNYGDTPVCRDSGSATSCYLYEPVTGLTFAWNSCSIEAAARAGGLSSVHYADYELMHVLGVFGRVTVTAYGDRARD